MLIQNINSAASVPLYASDGGQGSVAAPQAHVTHVELPQVAVKAPQEQQAPQPTSEQLKSAVDNINRTMKQSNSNIQFSVDEGSKQTVIKVVDTQTGQLISQFPSKQVLAISQSIGQSQLGVLVKQRA
jgi:flagellar protein FlaG